MIYDVGTLFLHAFNTLFRNAYLSQIILIILRLPLQFFSDPRMSSSVLSHLLQCLTGLQAINVRHAIYEPFEVIYIQALMVSYVRLSLTVRSLA